MKTYKRVALQLHSFLLSAVGGGQCLAPRYGRFTKGKALHAAISYEVEWAPDRAWTLWTREPGEVLIRKELNA
jgi:hypothetical protein